MTLSLSLPHQEFFFNSILGSHQIHEQQWSRDKKRASALTSCESVY